MKKTLLLLSVLLVLLLGACQVSVSPDLFRDYSSSAPAETSAAPKDTPAPETAEPTVDVTLTPLPSPTEDQTAGLLGEVEGNMYINKTFGFSAVIPDGWEVASEEELSTLFGFSSDLLEKETGLKANTEAGIMYCSKYGASSGTAGPNVNIVVSNKAETMSLLASEDGLNEFLAQYESMLSDVFDDGELTITSEAGLSIGGKEYSVLHIDGTLNGSALYEDQYFTAVGDNVLIITETYFDKSDKAEAHLFLEGMQYD